MVVLVKVVYVSYKRKGINMIINEEYKNFECVQKLEPNLKQRFFTIVSSYAMNLPERVVLDNSVYTLHDFNHHCVDIYKIISYYLLYPKTVYERTIGLSARELYILDLAVLFHDYSMSNSLTVTRKNHSAESAEFVYEQYNRTDSVFRTNCDLTVEEIKALMAIIKAHSDVKDGTVPAEKNGIYSPELRNYDARYGGPIRAAFLAGILRLADELDVTSARLGTNSIESQLSDLKRKIESGIINKSNERYENMIESLYFWKIQHYFSSMVINDRGVLCIQVDDNYVQQSIDCGGEKMSIEADINKIMLKITKQFEVISQQLFSLIEVKIYVLLSKIIVKSNILNLEARE